jgi:biotin carboxyl carrier protein
LAVKYVTLVGDRNFNVDVVDANHVSVDGKVMEVDFENISGQPVYSLVIDGRSYEAYVYEGEAELQVLLLGQLYPVVVEDEREKRLKAAAGGSVSDSVEYHLKAPMPGLVVAIPVEPDQQVEKGQVILILESMKMQNELKSPRAGRISRLRVKAGDTVEQRQTLLTVS